MRYFFHLREGDTVIMDRVGLHLSDLKSAIDAAKSQANALVVKAARSGRSINWGTEYEVEDDAGKLVLVLPLSHFVEIAKAA